VDIQRVYVGVLKVQGVQNFWTVSFMVVELMFHLFVSGFGCERTIFADSFFDKYYHRKISDFFAIIPSILHFHSFSLHWVMSMCPFEATYCRLSIFFLSLH
jgi:hypothetical protein